MFENCRSVHAERLSGLALQAFFVLFYEQLTVCFSVCSTLERKLALGDVGQNGRRRQ